MADNRNRGWEHRSGDVIAGRYRVIGIAGRGGTSVVYKAEDLEAENAIRAVKHVSKADRNLCEMANRESQLIKELYEKDKTNGFFPNIIHRFEDSSNFYIVQDYLDGESMDDMLKAGPMPYKVFIEAAKQLCLFMKFFHDTGRIHSDMKPDNIMVLRPVNDNGSSDLSNREIKLKFIDFGTVIGNDCGVTGYTPEYAAPEQYKESKLDERTDIFNIGATFYHMIEGRKPKTVYGHERVRYSDERFKFDKNVNSEVKRIIQKCVMDSPRDRYQSCNAIYKDLCHIDKHAHIRYIAAAFILAAVSFAGSGFAAFRSASIKEVDNNDKYNANVKKGDYAAAIKIDHTNRDDIYSKLIENFVQDERLDNDENNFIINEIKSQDYIKPSDKNYGVTMYEIGNAYWLYYSPNEAGELNDLELEKSRINMSYEWFENAIEDEGFAEKEPDKYKRAEIFYNIGRFYTEIDRKEKDGTDDSEFYTNMWESITEMAEYIDNPNEVVSARVCQTLLSLISRYSAKFKQNGTDIDEQKQIITAIEKKVYDDGNISYLNNYSIDIAEKFDTKAVRAKIEMAYAE